MARESESQTRPSCLYRAFQFPAVILCVLSADFIFACSIFYASKVAGPGQQSIATGLFNLSTQLGTAIGLAIATIVQTKVVDKKVANVIVSTSSSAPPFCCGGGAEGGILDVCGFFVHGFGGRGTVLEGYWEGRDEDEEGYGGGGIGTEGQGIWTSIGADDTELSYVSG
ncbi:hypothetical protein MVLG_02999 [Microbotryum lychnidis-dioicae p1A1 Lamole]|uniref:Major facilitator superfamily (MFS) profile domain-containing protein n=1 Tax=Microbotryum lychnidis-dioicae (strain p1A1 Lamole / MvSl-1064) TaxID=683840 RepID=U5H6V3_USTV1|nr:hypothetical protein MVLG_02999 [Microbotryum lychnidis-dioicae p1A1 Lamole]|eukprot:KDE06647.1 hypothetical protein MVLG_02999 [Microbotryum lychnidis-dioicae p1A1 Lamole]